MPDGLVGNGDAWDHDDIPQDEIHYVGKYPGGPNVSRYGPSKFDEPGLKMRADVLGTCEWSQIECAILADGFEMGIIAIATHPDFAAEIVKAHNASIREGRT